MKRCPVCEGLLNDSLFKPGHSICRVCQSRLRDNEEGRTDDTQERHRTIRQAHVELLLAIRQQAVNDDALETWEAYWLVEDPWPTIWKLLQDVIDREEEVKQGLKTHV